MAIRLVLLAPLALMLAVAVGCGSSDEPVADSSTATSSGHSSSAGHAGHGSGHGATTPPSGPVESTPAPAGAAASSQPGAPAGGAGHSSNPYGSGQSGGASSAGGHSSNPYGTTGSSGGHSSNPYGTSTPAGGGHSSNPYGGSSPDSGPAAYGVGGEYGYPAGDGAGAMGGVPGWNEASAMFDAGALAEAIASVAEQETSNFPNDYGAQAEMAFRQGYEQLAHELLMAHLALEPELAGETYSQVRFSRPLQRPLWNLRWGMSIALHTPDDFDGNVDPVTEDMQGASGRGTGSYGGSAYGGSSSGGYGSTSGAPARAVSPQALAESVDNIESNLGLFASVTAEEFDKRFSRGDFGAVFAQMGAPASIPPDAAAGRAPQPGAPAGSAYPAPSSYPEPSSYPTVAGPGESGHSAPGESRGPSSGPAAGGHDTGGSQVNLPAARTAGGSYVGNRAPGQSGNAPQPAGPAAGGHSGPMGSAPAPAGAPSSAFRGTFGGDAYGGAAASARDAMPSIGARTPAQPRWRPGIVYLGGHLYNEAVQAAAEADVDFLIHFDVNIETRRDGVENQTRARVVNVASPNSPVGSSRRLSTLEVRARNRSGNASPRAMVAEALQPMFDAIDRQTALIPLPPLSAAQAEARVVQLIADRSISPVSALAEVQLFRYQGTLSDDQAMLAAEMLLGDDGIKLFAGSEQVRQEVRAQLQQPLVDYAEIGLASPNAEPPGRRGSTFPGSSVYP